MLPCLKVASDRGRERTAHEEKGEKADERHRQNGVQRACRFCYSNRAQKNSGGGGVWGEDKNKTQRERKTQRETCWKDRNVSAEEER